MTSSIWEIFELSSEANETIFMSRFKETKISDEVLHSKTCFNLDYISMIKKDYIHAEQFQEIKV